MQQPALFYYLALALTSNVGVRTARALIDFFGSPEAVFRASKKSLLTLNGIGEVTAQSILSQSSFAIAEREITFLEKEGVEAILFDHPNYPLHLQHQADAPLVLFWKGDFDLQHQKMVAIVGTRKPTERGKQFTEEFIAELKPYNICFVSGLAYGIDITAHRKCLSEGLPTIGVMGNGMKHLYPKEHREDAIAMLQNGGLLTEFSSEAGPEKEHFPMRNRIIAGMSIATVVIETDIKGGSMITAYLANDYNKSIFAVPGRVNDTRSAGCNFLIKTSRAELIEGAEDFVKSMGWGEARLKRSVQTKLLLDLNTEEQVIVDALSKEEFVYIEALLNLTDWGHSRLSTVLLEMELKDIIQALPGKRYSLR